MSVNGGGGQTPCPQLRKKIMFYFFKEKKMQNVLKLEIFKKNSRLKFNQKLMF